MNRACFRVRERRLETRHTRTTPSRPPRERRRAALRALPRPFLRPRRLRSTRFCLRNVGARARAPNARASAPLKMICTS